MFDVLIKNQIVMLDRKHQHTHRNNHKGLKLINCEMIDTDLCFEKSEVEATITTSVRSIKNPLSGQYHARYSPFIVLFRTVTFFACQKASFVSNIQFSNIESSIYWKEYFK